MQKPEEYFSEASIKFISVRNLFRCSSFLNSVLAHKVSSCRLQENVLLHNFEKIVSRKVEDLTVIFVSLFYF